MIDWKFAINDNTVLGWLITALYFLAFLLAVVCLRRVRDGASRGIWRFVAMMMLFLGLNKQLDLHNLLRDIGRAIATALNLYDSRRELQFYFILALAFLLLLIVTLIGWRGGRQWAYHPWLLLGLAIIVGYAGFEATSFNHLNPLASLVDWPLFDLIELVGILFVILDGTLVVRHWQRIAQLRQKQLRHG